MSPKVLFLVLLCPAFVSTANAVVTTNRWADTTGGEHKWETALEWSLGVPPSQAQSYTVIDQKLAGGHAERNIVIDADTVASNAINGCLTISNLITSISVNNLYVNDTGSTPLTVLDSLSVSNGSTLSISNSIVCVGTPGGTLSVDGTLLLNTGSLIGSNVHEFAAASNDTANVGDTGTGQMTVLDGMWLAGTVNVGIAPGSQGTLTLAGGTTFIHDNMSLGYQPGSAGAVWLTGGQLIISNATYIGGVGTGQMTVSNGTWVTPELVSVGNEPGSVGTLTIAGGASTLQFGLYVGYYGGGGAVWITGGQLTVGNWTYIGNSGTGQMAVSNGTLQAVAVFVGDSSTLTVAGGSNTLSSTLNIGPDDTDGASTGTVWLTGGLLTTLNDVAYVGQYGVGRMTVSNGNWFASEVDVGETYGAQGTLTMLSGLMVVTNGAGQIAVGGAGVGRMSFVGGSIIAQTVCVACTNGPTAALTITGGSLTVLGNLEVGDCTANGFGVVQMGGDSTVYVTNAAHNAVLDVRNGVFLLESGTLVVDILVATNECDGTFDHIGGTLTVGTLILDPDQDTDGDGLPNGWEQAHRLDPLSSIGDNGADGDPDGDGYSNYQEYLAGSDPQNPLSTLVQIVAPPFQITSIVQSGKNIVLTWNTAGGLTNQVEVTSGETGGSYSTTGFTSLGPQLIIGGSGLTTTNYTDTGGATNKPARYYRVRLVP